MTPAPRSTQVARPARRRQALLAGAAAVAVAVVAVAAVSAGADDVALTVASPAGPSSAPAASAGPTTQAARDGSAGSAEPKAARGAAAPSEAPGTPATDAATEAPATSPATAATTTPTTSPTTAPAKASPAPSSPAASGARTVLEGEGLGFASGSSTRRLTFAEADAATVLEAVRRALGEGRTSQQPDCGPGLRAYDTGGLRLLLSGERFLGWSVQGASGRLATADGIGVGTTLAELRASRSQVEVRDSTVGTRWTAGGLSGLLDGDDSTSRVTLIAAGQTCSFD